MRKKEEYKARAQALQVENDYLAKEADSLRKDLRELTVDRGRIQQLEQEKATLLQKYEDERKGKLTWRREYHELQETSAREKESLKGEWARAKSELQQSLDDQTKKVSFCSLRPQRRLIVTAHSLRRPALP
jgi:DNA anti-recombination protein RmuC